MVEGDGVVIGHRAGVLEAEIVVGVSFLRPGNISRAGLGRFDLETGIEFG